MLRSTCGQISGSLQDLETQLQQLWANMVNTHILIWVTLDEMPAESGFS